MLKHWGYTVNNIYGWQDYVLAITQEEALKLIFGKHQGARIYPVGGRWGREIPKQEVGELIC